MRILFDNGTPRGVVTVSAAAPGSYTEVEIPVE